MNRREFLNETLGWLPYIGASGFLGWFAFHQYKKFHSQKEYSGRIINRLTAPGKGIELLTLKVPGDNYLVFAVQHDDWLRYGRPSTGDSVSVTTGSDGFAMSYKRKEIVGSHEFRFVPDEDISAKFGLEGVEGGLEKTLNPKHLNEIHIKLAESITKYQR
ncbi:hypothetical protein D6764_04105 [Candidatus Woesearchaeota archaeon]|nr:MAG: hypothetical protein D6764_04105 [Candidatus Woesearchaeota archaeon]